MKQNKKAAICAKDYGSNTNLKRESNMNTILQNKPQLQHNSSQPERKAFVCDLCALPLHLYGENFIESYSNGRANILRCLCDLHAAELEVSE